MKRLVEKMKGKTGYILALSLLSLFLCLSLLHDLVLETDYSIMYKEVIQERDSINSLLETQKKETAKYKSSSDSLYLLWSSGNIDSLKIIINNKYDEKRNTINTLSNDELVRELSDWFNELPEETRTPR